jgi:hypothetical protein
MRPRLTEAEWLAAEDLIGLDIYRSAWKQFRKWRLFGAACCRQAMTLTPDARLDCLVASAEEFADDLIGWEDVKKVRRTIPQVRKELGERFGPDEAKYDVLIALDRALRQKPIATLGATEHARYAFAARSRPDFDGGCKRAEREQVIVARDIFGNPFRPVSFLPEWRSDTAIALASQMYESRDFGAMPILADALQDAGCDNQDILNHCRDAKQVHVRGCWVVDLVLSKQ